MKTESIYEIWDRFERSSLSEFEIESQGTRLHFVRHKEEAVSGSGPSNEKRADNETVAGHADISFQGIKAPLAGTFYLASSPDNEPYIKVGQQIKKGDVVGIVEAMKLMNEVKADSAGTVEEIMADDGNLVEFGQPLVRIKYV